MTTMAVGTTETLIENVDYEGGQLVLTLNHAPSTEWIKEFGAIGVVYADDAGPRSFTFAKNIARVMIRSEAAAIQTIDSVAGWFAITDRRYSEYLERVGREQAKRDAEAQAARDKQDAIKTAVRAHWHAKGIH